MNKRKNVVAIAIGAAIVYTITAFSFDSPFSLKVKAVDESPSMLVSASDNIPDRAQANTASGWASATRNGNLVRYKGVSTADGLMTGHGHTAGSYYGIFLFPKPVSVEGSAVIGNGYTSIVFTGLTSAVDNVHIAQWINGSNDDKSGSDVNRFSIGAAYNNETVTVDLTSRTAYASYTGAIIVEIYSPNTTITFTSIQAVYHCVAA